MSDTPVRTTVPDSVPLSALMALFSLTLRQMLRGKRLLGLLVLFALPVGLVILVRNINPDYNPEMADEAILFQLFSHALIPLTALLFASSIIQDEIEDQTLTYLLLRPIPRWALYLTKLFAAWFVTVCVVSVFTMLTCVAIYWGLPDFDKVVLRGLLPKLLAIQTLCLAAYTAVFGLASLYTRRSLLLGVVFIVLFEWFISNFEFIVRRLTVIFYYRVLVARWIGRSFNEWELDLVKEPSSFVCSCTLVGITGICLLWAMFTFNNNEFRVKTPEGS